MELFEMYDIDRKPVGMQIVRGNKVPDGCYHNVVHCCVFNTKGEMLIQQRQPFKDGWSNMWDITMGGSAVAGENSREAVTREMREEVGMELDFSTSRPAFTINFGHIIDDIYIIDRDVDETTLTLQAEEVQRVCWASAEKIKSMIESGEFIPYWPSLIDFIFDWHRNKNMRFRRDDTVPAPRL